jgi:hypothetical protein
VSTKPGQLHIDMRPIYHQTDERAQAHIFVAALASLLHRAL